jgi:hypothetical protein
MLNRWNDYPIGVDLMPQCLSKTFLDRTLAVNCAVLCRINTLAQEAGWVAAWGTSQQSQGEMKITNATVRMIARVTLSGDATASARQHVW